MEDAAKATEAQWWDYSQMKQRRSKAQPTDYGEPPER
jgi:hypothetical protein